MKKILYIGQISIGQTSRERLLALEDLGHSVISIQSNRNNTIIKRLFEKLFEKTNWHIDLSKLNKDIIKQIEIEKFDIVWIDKGSHILPSTLRLIKENQPNCILVHINPDDPFGKFRNGWKRFFLTIPLYDVHFVSRTANIREYRDHGALTVYEYDRSYSKHLHFPVQLTKEDYSKFHTPIGFVGTHAHDRARSIAYLIKNGINVTVYGNNWPDNSFWDIIKPFYRGPSQFGESYAKIINGMDIALHFLRKENRDAQDSRTFEIPACGTFMIAERSPKHEAFFKEDVESVFFSTDEELLHKVRYYLSNPEKVRSIGYAGYLRCINSGYDHHSRMKSFIDIVIKNH